MNFREGMRRLGLTLGIVGALVGSLPAYLEFQQFQSQRNERARFESLMNSEIMRDLAKKIAEQNIRNTTINLKHDGIKAIYLDEQGNPKVPAKTYFDEHGNPVAVDSFIPDKPTPGFLPEKPAAPLTVIFEEPLEVKTDRIEEVEVNQTGGVIRLKLENGNMVENTPVPATASYVEVALIPLVGFLIPWGVIRLITWIALGFLRNSS
jgi:hypothetical protein